MHKMAARLAQGTAPMELFEKRLCEADSCFQELKLELRPGFRREFDSRLQLVRRYLPFREDGKHYLVSYNDCCGAASCGRCFCNENEGERPGYRMGVHNDINWCMGNESSVYHCTVSIVLGESGSAAG